MMYLRISAIMLSMIVFSQTTMAVEYHYHFAGPVEQQVQNVSSGALSAVEQELQNSIAQAQANGDAELQKSLEATLATAQESAQRVQAEEKQKLLEKEKRLLRAMYKKGYASGADWEKRIMIAIAVAAAIPAIAISWKLMYWWLKA